jgi:hypothetical protein
MTGIWYLQLVAAGARQHALPREYVSAITARPSIVDLKLDRKSRLDALKLFEANAK